jgi:hypothetical protein
MKIIPEHIVRRVRAHLILKGISNTDIALAAGRSINTVKVVKYGFGKSRHIQKSISQLLNIDHKKLWGKAA